MNTKANIEKGHCQIILNFTRCQEQKQSQKSRFKRKGKFLFRTNSINMRF